MIETVIFIIIFLILFIIAYFLYVFDNYSENKRNQYFKKYAEIKKYSYKHEENSILINYNFESFKNEPWQTAQRVVEGYIDTTKIIIFDCGYEVGLGRNKKSNKQTVVIFNVNFDLSKFKNKINTKNYFDAFIKKTNIEIYNSSLLMYKKSTILKANDNEIDNFINKGISIVKLFKEGKI